jgi:hypothetical protein
LLHDNRDRLDALALALAEAEALDETAAYEAAGLPVADHVDAHGGLAISPGTVS